MPKLIEKLKHPEHLRQQLGGLLMIALAVFSRQVPLDVLWTGGALCVAGIMGRVYCSGFLVKNDRLTTTGFYGWVRNPIYVFNYVMGAGLALMSGLWAVGFGALALLFVFAYLPGMRTEAANLQRRYGEAYDEFARAVPLFIPRLTCAPGYGGGSWSWRAYLDNREQYVTAGSMLIVAWIALKWQPGCMWVCPIF